MLSEEQRTLYVTKLMRMAALLSTDPTARPCLYLEHQWLVILTGPEDLDERPEGFDGDLILNLPCHPCEED